MTTSLKPNCFLGQKSFIFKFGGKINKVQSEGLIILFSFRKELTYPMHVSPPGLLKKNKSYYVDLDRILYEKK